MFQHGGVSAIQANFSMKPELGPDEGYPFRTSRLRYSIELVIPKSKILNDKRTKGITKKNLENLDADMIDAKMLLRRFVEIISAIQAMFRELTSALLAAAYEKFQFVLSALNPAEKASFSYGYIVDSKAKFDRSKRFDMGILLHLSERREEWLSLQDISAKYITSQVSRRKSVHLFARPDLLID